MQTAITCHLVQNYASENQSEDGSWLWGAQTRAAHGCRSIAGESRTLLVLIPLYRRCRVKVSSSPLLMLQYSLHPFWEDTGQKTLNSRTSPHPITSLGSLPPPGSICPFFPLGSLFSKKIFFFPFNLSQLPLAIVLKISLLPVRMWACI